MPFFDPAQEQPRSRGQFFEPDDATVSAPKPSPQPQDLSWRQGKPPTVWEKLQHAIGLSGDTAANSAKAANALTYSEMLNVSPSFAYDNHDDISARMKEVVPGEKVDTRTRGGVIPAAKAGFKNSIVGMMANQKAPEPFDSLNQLERWSESAAQMAGDLPTFLSGAAIGGGLAGGFGLTAGMRQLLTETYKKGQIKTWGEFADRTTNAVKQTIGGEIVGKSMDVAGKIPGKPYIKAAS